MGAVETVNILSVMMKRFLVICLLVVSAVLRSSAGNGDTVHVITHNKVLIQTDPSVGHTEYRGWGVFPAPSLSVRKIKLTMSYACPGGLHCGEWDYINAVYIRKKGGVNGDSMRTEIARFITPYGWSLSSKWQFSWDLDMTDYALLLRDSVEIEYVHTGYEAKADRGWLVTLDFQFEEGPPAMEAVKIEEAWNGWRAYGDDNNTFNSGVLPINVTVDTAADLVRMRLVQTGHGSDVNGCCEFMPTFRNVKADNVVVKRDTLWRECGNNALYPQAGTWVYARGNWCPGSVIDPLIVDMEMPSGSSHQVGFEMDPYSVSSASGNFTYGSQLIHYKAPTISNDATMVDIKIPSTKSIYGRMNPDCGNPKIRVKNNGKNDITSMTIAYGYSTAPYTWHGWKGVLKPQQEIDIQLGSYQVPSLTDSTFNVEISQTNGKNDGYAIDNKMTSYSKVPPVFPSSVIVYYRPNKNGDENECKITDAWGKVWYQKSWSGLSTSTIYRDTVRNLPGGCYNFTITDSQEDGIDFWANSSQVGSGALRLFSGVESKVLATVAGDFGSFNTVKFMVGNPTGVNEQFGRNTIDIKAYPNPGNGVCSLDLGEAGITEAAVVVMDMLGNNVYQTNYRESGDGVLRIDLSVYNAGLYLIQVNGKAGVQTVKWMLNK